MPIDFERNVHCLLGLPFDAVDMAGAVRHIRRVVEGRQPCFLTTPNLNFLVASRGDTGFRDSVIASDLVVADGMPLVWVARLLGIPIRERVAGSTLFEVLRGDSKNPVSVYFFGGPEGVAEQACRQLNVEAAGLRCVGFECPGFGSVEDMSSDQVIDRINASRADFLVVALGARKGQEWIVRNRERIAVPLISHLGAVVNFVAGSVSRAPRWMQFSGLEWLWRIKEEPGLWRRYFGDGVAFSRLLATRVLPLAWYMRRQRPFSGTPARAAVERVEDESLTVLRLSGAWNAENLAPLRRAFAAIVENDTDVCLDLAGVSPVDSAFVGLVMLLHGHQSRCGRHLMIEGIRDEVARVFGWCCVGYLLDSSQSKN